MKYFIKLRPLLIAVIVVIAAVSCTPEAELTPYNWKDHNQQFNPSNTNVAAHNFTVTSTLGLSNADPVPAQEVIITFPVTADVLKETEARIERKLKEFLSFSHFTNPTTWTVGQISTFQPIDNWSFVKSNGNVVTIRINKPFVASDSNVLLKIDGTRYTYAGGIKMDRDNNGIAGEAVYDDYQTVLNVAGIDNPVSPVFNQSLGWTITLWAPAGGTFTTGAPTILPFNIGTTNISLSATDAAAATTERNTICNSFTSRFGVQKNNAGTGWRWQNVSGSVSWVSDDNVFRFPATTVENMTAYRVVWNGSTKVTSANPYYGVRQRINIDGSGLKHDLGRIETQAGFYYNSDTHAFVPQDHDISVTVNRDSIGKNVVLEVELNVPFYKPGGIDLTAYYFKEVSKDIFIRNCKIASIASTDNISANVNDFQRDGDVNFISISSVEFIKRDLPATGTSGFNVIRIALDPDYSIHMTGVCYFYLNNKIGMADDRTTFGTPNNWENDFYQIYRVQQFPREVTVLMYDSYGDGWDGAGALRINVNGVDIATNVKVHNNASGPENNNPPGQRNTNIYTFDVFPDDDVQFYWVAGSNQTENSFIVYYTSTPPIPVFSTTVQGPTTWSGNNALLYRIRGSAPAGLNGVAGGTLLGTFTVP